VITLVRGAVRDAGRRLSAAGWTIVQTPVAAGLAWYIAHTLLGHREPFFAPVAAAVSLSATRVLRGQRALQLMAGVVLGIGIGAAVKAVAGSTSGVSGAVAIAVATLIALVAALVLGAGLFEQGVLFVNQSTISAILIIAVAGTATASERLFDALIGGGCTLLIAVILFPSAPLPIIQRAAQQVFGTLRDTVERVQEFAATGRPADPQWVIATGARVHQQLAGLQQAQATARQVAGFVPRRWHDRSRVRLAGQQTAPLPLLAGTILSMVHAVASAPRAGPPLPAALRDALGELTAAFAVLAKPGDPAPGDPAPADSARAAGHATRARALATAADQTSPRAQLMAWLIETAADDTARFAAGPSPAITPGGQPSSP
jgi:uncharacterized membrane protein YgaE (UPF0421/DUF939 family)